MPWPGRASSPARSAIRCCRRSPSTRSRPRRSLPAGLGSQGAGPDVVLYGDDYGYQAGMFLSDQDFRTFVLPRLRTLFSRIRRHTGAAICFHCCGAVRAILPDLAGLVTQNGAGGMLNLQYDAKGMDLAVVRKAIPKTVTLHGYTDLRALGQAVTSLGPKAVAILTSELVASLPAVAAPVDCLATEAELTTAATGARFVRALSAEDIDALRRFGRGPVQGT
ncbi:MAG TPA: uroporphyrinogen decarboxylase family protein [Trebonia sp.]